MFLRSESAPEIGRVQVEMLMIKPSSTCNNTTFEIEEIHDHTGAWIDFTRDSHFQHIVVTMAGIVIAGSERRLVLCGIPLGL